MAISIVSASAIDTRRVRVVFSGNVDDSDPAHWTLTGQSPGPVAAAGPVPEGNTTRFPSVPPVSVLSFNSDDSGHYTTVDLLTSCDLSPGKLYLVVASGIADLASSPGDRVVVQAFVPPVPAGRDFALEDMMPAKNWKEDNSGDLRKFVDIIQDPVTIMTYAVDRWPDILDPDACPEQFLDPMLNELGNPFGFLDLTPTEQRKLADNLVAIYKLKGTARGIQSAIRFFFSYDATILVTPGVGLVLGEDGITAGVSQLGQTEGPAGTWILGDDAVVYDFQVRVGKPGAAALTADEYRKIEALVKYLKPAHTNMTLLTSALPAPLNVIATPSAGHITVSWSAVTGAAGGYTVYSNDRPNVSPYNGQPDSVAAGTVSWQETVTTGVMHFYIVCALDGTTPTPIEGSASAEVFATAG